MLGFWAIVMRPARNQQKRVEHLQSDLAVGHQVMLSSGIFGTIHALAEAKVELEVAPGTVVTVARQAVVRRVDEPDGPTSPEHDQLGESNPPQAED
jgi:preprotein translocase subunit YajC